MASTQIEQLRVSFDKMSTTQKKAFIDRLRGQLQGKNNPEYSKFLSECVQKYNAAVRGDSSSPDKTPMVRINSSEKTVSTKSGGSVMNSSRLIDNLQEKVNDIQKRIDWVIGKISKQINTQEEFDKIFGTFQSIAPDMIEAKGMIDNLHEIDPTSAIGLRLENQLYEQKQEFEDLLEAFQRVLG